MTPSDWAFLMISHEDGTPELFLVIFSEVFPILKGLRESNRNQNPQNGGENTDGISEKGFDLIEITNHP